MDNVSTPDNKNFSKVDESQDAILLRVLNGDVDILNRLESTSLFASTVNWMLGDDLYRRDIEDRSLSLSESKFFQLVRQTTALFLLGVLEPSEIKALTEEGLEHWTMVAMSLAVLHRKPGRITGTIDELRGDIAYLLVHQIRESQKDPTALTDRVLEILKVTSDDAERILGYVNRSLRQQPKIQFH